MSEKLERGPEPKQGRYLGREPAPGQGQNVFSQPGGQAKPSSEGDPTVIVPVALGGEGAPAPGVPPQGERDVRSAILSGDASVLNVGTKLAEFVITRVIGQGGFGVVYEAHDTSLDRVVAIKEYLPVALSVRLKSGTVMPLSQRQHDTFELGLRSFINEARLLAQFDHPSLVKVLRFWQQSGTAYMSMYFYKGRTLRQALRRYPDGAPEQWVLQIADGLTQGLAVMHKANCYHRDIAPDNIILQDGSGLPVLLDFGAARHVITDKTQALTVILKPGYAPIEQYAQAPNMSQGAWTDIYALCAVLHVALTGEVPPPSVARVLADTYTPLVGKSEMRSRYSTRLLTAIDAGLAVRPEERPPTMEALRKLFGLDEPPVEPIPPPAPQAEPSVVKAPKKAGPAVVEQRAKPLKTPFEADDAHMARVRSFWFAALILGALLAMGAGAWFYATHGPKRHTALASNAGASVAGAVGGMAGELNGGGGAGESASLEGSAAKPMAAASAQANNLTALPNRNHGAQNPIAPVAASASADEQLPDSSEDPSKPQTSEQAGLTGGNGLTGGTGMAGGTGGASSAAAASAHSADLPGGQNQAGEGASAITPITPITPSTSASETLPALPALPSSGAASAAGSAGAGSTDQSQGSSNATSAAAKPNGASPVPVPSDPLLALESLAGTSASAFEVSAKAFPSRVKIGSGQIKFEIRSMQKGYVYVFMRSTNGILWLLFPNKLDGRNTIGPGQRMVLPRRSWPVSAGGPPGIDHLVILVSENKRSFELGHALNNKGLFGQFSHRALKALTAQGVAQPLLGVMHCNNETPCQDRYAVTSLKITER